MRRRRQRGSEHQRPRCLIRSRASRSQATNLLPPPRRPALQQPSSPLASEDSSDAPCRYSRPRPPPVNVTQQALSVTQRARSVTQRALSVTQRALSVTQRALNVTQRALSVTQRALSVTQRASTSNLLREGRRHGSERGLARVQRQPEQVQRVRRVELGARRPPHRLRHAQSEVVARERGVAWCGSCVAAA
jgi:hypothetical protein